MHSHAKHHRLSRGAVAGALAMLLAACGSVPFDYPKTESAATSVSAETRLGREAIEWRQQHDDLSGFVALTSGNDGLGARLKMMEAAQVSIDAQYFLIKPDQAGRLFLGKLLLAADRGVRVRFLIDDVFTPGMDSALALVNSHPNVEVRMFNPLSRQGLRNLNMLGDLKRTNRRMHNKSFTVDDSLTIIGGRNIAEEYFEIQQEVEFDDFEVLAIGPVVSDVGSNFDIFWNSDLAVPMEAFGIPVEEGKLDYWRQVMREVTSGERPSVYAKAINSPLISDIVDGRLQPAAGAASVVSDMPEKLMQSAGDQEFRELANEIIRRFDAAGEEIVIVTPYFVPRKSGVEIIERLCERGVQVSVITNSLASTNHAYVHSGYARYRKRLLQSCTRLYEIKADAVGPAGEDEASPNLLTLHTKAVIIDRKSVFIGSLNFDPRSIDINTEMGVFIDSPHIADGLSHKLWDGLPEIVYQVTLDENDKLRWTHEWQGEKQVLDKEPLTGFWKRFAQGFYRILPIENQL